MKNQVIEVLNKEHGRKVIEYWKSKGVDVRGLSGNQTREDDSKFRFYGFINGEFNNYRRKSVYLYKAKIIELPIESPKEEEKSFPRVMLVSDDKIKWYKRVVFMKKCCMFLAWYNADTIEKAEFTYGVSDWSYAKELTEKVEITKAEISDKFGIPVDLIEIID